MSLKTVLTPACVTLMAALILAGCVEREVRLPGTRLDARAVGSPDGPAMADPVATGTALSLPGARANAEWTHRAASASHNSGHVALSGGLQLLFAAPIGQPSDKRHRISADPIVAGGRIFTLDSHAMVTATALSGGRTWSRDLVPAGENPNSGSVAASPMRAGGFSSPPAMANYWGWMRPRAMWSGVSALALPSAARPRCRTASSM